MPVRVRVEEHEFDYCTTCGEKAFCLAHNLCAVCSTGYLEIEDIPQDGYEEETDIVDVDPYAV